ncbi:MAG: thioredoxin [Clostridia bacterium]|nr:thioredoxin [Clostridia bacterium]MBR5615510.1 thioredoxin [Clostridia bacterium]MBR5880367.1 thioredoxin [Clostridia bacterium]
MPGYAIIVVRVALILVAVLMIVFGIFNGGMNDVLQKAIMICTECIGLG